MILVVCALLAELGEFARSGVDVVAVGVGPVEATIGTLHALAAKPYELLVNAGIGGAFAGRATVGDAVAVTDERYLDLGREDDSDLQLPGGVELEVRCSPDALTLERYRATAPPTGFGSGITSATITTTAARAALLEARYAPSIESMEGFAVLRAATRVGIPAIELRGVSNIVGDRAAGQWDFRAGSAAAVRALIGFLDVVKASV